MADNIKWYEKSIYSFFEFDASIETALPNDNVSGKCKLCPKSSQVKPICGKYRTSSNFLKHIKVKSISLKLFNAIINGK